MAEDANRAALHLLRRVFHVTTSVAGRGASCRVRQRFRVPLGDARASYADSLTTGRLVARLPVYVKAATCRVLQRLSMAKPVPKILGD